MTDRLSQAPAGPGSRGAVLVIPGGGYELLAAHEGEPYARWLAGLGFDAHVLYYSVSPHRWPTQLHEARAALRELRERTASHLPVGAIGSSAGAHLVAALSTATGPRAHGDVDRRPDFAILAYPVISFETEPHPVSTANLLGPSPSAALRRAVSVERHVDSATPPTFVWTTADDPTIPATQTLRYAEALIRAHIPVEVHVFPAGAHGLGLAGDSPTVGTWTTLAQRWLDHLPARHDGALKV